MFAASKTASVSGGYQISRSLRFNSADSPNLGRTPTTTSNQRTSTLSLWIKRGTLGAEGRIMANDSSGSATIFWVLFNSSDQIQIYTNGTGAGLVTTQVFRDPSAWYHIVVAVDTTQATGTNRIKLYVNGAQITAFTGTQTYYSLNEDIKFNSSSFTSYLGFFNTNAFNGYMTEVNWIDGQQLTPSSFGETNAQTGVWQPKAYSGSYGTNGFYLNFSDNSNTTAATLGKDYSGNGNNWTPNGFLVSAGVNNDSLVDSPTSYGVDTGVGGTVRGNYCTLNPLDFANGALSNGNLDWSATSGTGLGCFSTFAFDIADSTNQYYWEFTLNSGDLVFGIVPTTTLPSNTSRTGSYSYYTNGNKYSGTTATAYGASFTTGAVIGVSVGSGTITFYKNGVSQGAAFTGLTGIFKPAIWEVVCTATANFGQRPFAYTAPSGFKALCTQNLPTPTIGATTATQAGKYFNPVLYTGTGAIQTISTVGFSPGLMVLKNRTSGSSYVTWQDQLRGASVRLFSSLTNAESTDANGVSAFTSTGFSLGTNGNENLSGGSFVAWSWLANTSGSTNTAGSITSTVSANTTSGFSIVTYNGTGANATVGHGLGVAPSMIIIKSRSSAGTNWNSYHVSLGNSACIVLNLTIAAASGTSFFNATTPTSTVFSLGTDGSTNPSGAQQVAYCFAPIAGYSAFGSFTGNGSADGPFVYTGFRPACIIFKVTDGSASWLIHDNKRNTNNVVDKKLFPNLSDAEATADVVDFLSNGFKLRGTNTQFNGNGYNYIFAAFAENPFKFSLAR